MKKIKLFALTLVVVLTAGFASSCVKDLDVIPIDPNTTLPKDVLNTQEAFTSLLAKCYQGLCSSSSFGPSGDPDIKKIDGGYGQYFRAVINMNELSTDVLTCCWNDQTLFDIHNICWTPTDVFVQSMYSRIFYQISICNELIRQSLASEINGYPLKEQYMAEARALRAFSYYHAIDMFANVPFSDETSSVGSVGGDQIKRADLFEWLVNECNDLLSANSSLPAPGQAEYGRCDQGMVQMILAKLYLNAEIWAGKAMYKECADVCAKIIAEYPLHNNYEELFMADNNRLVKCTTNGATGDELIFVAPQDGDMLQSYGSTNYLVFGSTFAVTGKEDKTMDASYLGISSGWSGLSLTGTFTSKFSEFDDRAMFFKGGFNQFIDAIRDADGASEGWKSMKFRNVNHDGSAAKAQGFVDIDFPVFRSADAYLMYAECAARGAAGVDKALGQQYLNAVSNRANAGNLELSLQNIIDERGRELYLEGFRRQDLVRFGLFTSGDYLWEFKGGVPGGQAVDSHYNIYPIISSDLNANGKLEQNFGY